MRNIFERIDYLLELAEKSATLNNAGFGFPDDRIEIKSVHFGDDDTGRVGDVLHPTDYVRGITRIHHRSWIIHPIQEVRALLDLHSDLINGAIELGKMLDCQQIKDISACAEGLRVKALAGLEYKRNGADYE